MTEQTNAILENISQLRPQLTRKGKILGDYIVRFPRKVVFMTTKELAETCQVSEATVVRFVARIGYSAYSQFQQALRDYVDTESTLPERFDMTDSQAPESDRFHRVIFQEMDNLKQLFKTLNMEALGRVINLLRSGSHVYVIGSRIAYMFAYYMGWSLTRIRKNVRILKGSDTTTLDWLGMADPENLVVVIFATSRYPNELIRVAKYTMRLGIKLVLITDSAKSPLIQFSHESIVVPSRFIPFTGSPIAICSLINFISLELANLIGNDAKEHQKKLEQHYLENDIFFNLKSMG
ncbi:MAG: MurR/RpiR family transcriptional regulator [Desulfobacterales bacterium]